MRHWIVYGSGVIILGAAAWYLGKPAKAPAPTPTQTVAEVAPAEAPKESPPRVIEVIDLARAYEPVPEPEEVLPGGVDPASFIQLPEAPGRIPPAIDVDASYADVIRTVRDAPSGWSFWTGPDQERIDLMPREVRPSTRTDDAGFWGFGSGRVQDLLFFEEEPRPVRLDVMPREVPAIANGLLNFVATPRVSDGLVFIPMGVPFLPAAQPIPPNASIEAPIEVLNVMPRQVLSLQDCLIDCNPPSGPLRWSSGRPHLLDVMPREVTVEKLTIMPRALRIQAEEQERSTGDRDDDFIGP